MLVYSAAIYHSGVLGARYTRFEMAWFYVFIAGLLEVGWAMGLKYSEGFTKPLPAVITVILMIASFAFLGLALRQLPLGTAYAVWTGIGTAGTAIFGMIMLGESTQLLRIACILLIMGGVAGLKFLTPN